MTFVFNGIRYISLGGNRGAGLFTFSEEKYRDILLSRKWYVATLGHIVSSRGVLLHKLILPGEKKLTDHINGNKFDNRSANLRLVTPTENIMNVRRRRHSSQVYKGVRRKSSLRWEARIGHEKKQIYLGSFTSPEGAARAYNEAAIKYFGPYACLNELEEK